MPEITGDSALFRQQLRKTLLAARAALSPERRGVYSETIIAQLRRWLTAGVGARPTAKSVGFCLPYRDECDLVPLLTTLAGTGWSISVPVVTLRAQPMVFYHWSPDSPINTDCHGVPVPATAECPVPALLLLPVVGVDARGFRLGYGGGYFDRTLAALQRAGQRPLCIGVGFACAQIDDLRPQPHDQALDMLVTEEGLTEFATPHWQHRILSAPPTLDESP